MSKRILEYTEKHHVIIVDGKEYEIPQRTAGIEKKLIERNKKLAEMSEYEQNISFLNIMFGEDAVKEMFPDGDNTNLDKLEECAIMVETAFMLTHTQREQERKRREMEYLNPLFKQLNASTKALQNVNHPKNKYHKDKK